MATADLQVLQERYRPLGEAVCTRLQQELDRLGLAPADAVAAPRYCDAAFAVVIDPYSGAQDLTGHWYGAGQAKIGSLQFHAAGTFFAEYDVVRLHPRKPQWFVESITVWGTADNIKSEPKLLAALQDGNA